MLSCDTFALGKNFYEQSRNLFAKNSDRPLGEAQPIAFYPGGDHADGEMLQCTHLSIPQVQKTYTVLGSRPYWIWGFEMGVNEKGLAIGNEAEGSRCDPEETLGLLGMDLLRLALERAATAREGINIITSLLEEYGQNANASLLFDRRYENSYILTDPNEIWLLETAGRKWAAKKMDDWTAISNCYSIEHDFDLCSSDLEEYARFHRWLHPSEPFNFAKAYTLPASRQSHSTQRWRRMQKQIGAYPQGLSQETVFSILRDHFEGEIISPRWGESYGCFPSICMHAMTWDNSQTAASFINSWDDLLGPVSWYAPSIPCCSIFIPIYWTGDVPAALKHANGIYDPSSLWWETERLAMLISIDEKRFGPNAKNALHNLEKDFLYNAPLIEENAHNLLLTNKKELATETLSHFTEQAVSQTLELLHTLNYNICSELECCGGLYGPRKEFLKAYTEKTKLNFST